MSEKMIGLTSFVGVVGASLCSTFGGWTNSTSTLFWFMGIDYLTGIVLAMIFKKSPKTETGGLSSKVGWKGIAKKGMTILFLIIGYKLDVMLSVNYIKDGICIAFICNELVSITENATLIGFPTPSFITNAIDILKSKSDKVV